MFGPIKRAIGTILQAAPVFSEPRMNLACSLFTLVIIRSLTEARRPELKHLRLLADDKPAAGCE
jgi:hypothetical protein